MCRGIFVDCRIQDLNVLHIVSGHHLTIFTSKSNTVKDLSVDQVQFRAKTGACVHYGRLKIINFFPDILDVGIGGGGVGW